MTIIEALTRFWPAMLISCAWGFAEGTLFFLVPDVFLTLVAFFAPLTAMIACLATLLGALFAGAVVYTASTRDGVRTRALLSRVPFVRAWMWTHVRNDYQQIGWLAPRKGPPAGVPYKLYAAEAPLHNSLVRFLIASVPARLTRFILTAGACAAIGFLLAGPIARHQELVVTLHLIGWSVFYSVYWSRV